MRLRLAGARGTTGVPEYRAQNRGRRRHHAVSEARGTRFLACLLGRRTFVACRPRHASSRRPRRLPEQLRVGRLRREDHATGKTTGLTCEAGVVADPSHLWPAQTGRPRRSHARPGGGCFPSISGNLVSSSCSLLLLSSTSLLMAKNGDRPPRSR